MIYDFWDFIILSYKVFALVGLACIWANLRANRKYR